MLATIGDCQCRAWRVKFVTECVCARARVFVRACVHHISVNVCQPRPKHIPELVQVFLENTSSENEEVWFHIHV